MKAVLALVITWTVLVPGMVTTAQAAAARASRVSVSYVPPTMTRFADVHGTPAQRFYNVLCVAYGADAQLFGDMVQKGYLPKERAEDCKGEYQQVADAYEKLIGPHVDRSRAKKVFDKSWLPDATTRLPGRLGSPQPTPQTTTP